MSPECVRPSAQVRTKLCYGAPKCRQERYSPHLSWGAIGAVRERPAMSSTSLNLDLRLGRGAPSLAAALLLCASSCAVAPMRPTHARPNFDAPRAPVSAGAAPEVRQDVETPEPAKPAETVDTAETVDPAVTGEPAETVESAEGETDGAVAAAQDLPPVEEEERLVRGQLSTRLVTRATSDDSDVDLWTFLSVDVGDAEEHEFTARFSGRVYADLDGNTGDVFDGVEDTYDSSIHPRVYDAYAEWHRYDDVPLIRVGRQSDYETPVFLVYDGVRLESREFGDAGIQFGAYGGISTHQFESSSSGDLLGGAYVQARPWSGGRARVDFVHAEDKVSIGSLEENLLGPSLWQRINDRLRLQGQYTMLSGESRDIDLRANWFDVDSDFTLSATYYQLFETQSANPLEFDTFFESLFDYFPFFRAGLQGSKAFGDQFQLSGGLDVREVEDKSDVGSFNRDVQRYYLTAILDEVLTDDTTLSLTTDLWESDAQDTQSFGFDVTHAFSEETRGSIGTYYAAYKFDQVLATEREQVRTYYVACDRDLSEDLDLRLSYDFEDAEIDEFHTLRVKLTWRF